MDFPKVAAYCADVVVIVLYRIWMVRQLCVLKCIYQSYQSYVISIIHTSDKAYYWSHIIMVSCINVSPYKRVIIKTQRRIFINPFVTDSCVHLNTARYVLGSSKYFEQLKTPCPCRRLSFPPKSENFSNLRCCFYDLDESVLFFNHSLAASVSLYFCFGCFGCSGYCSSIAPSSNAGRK